jgi:hypothetical protein
MPRGRKRRTETTTDKIINREIFSSLMKEVSANKAEISSLSGEIGARIKNAANENNLHRGAFALMVRMKRMDEAKRNDLFRNIGLYFDVCTELGFFGAQTRDMFEEAGEETSEDAEETTASADSEPDIRPPFMKRDIDAEAAAQNAALLADGIKQLPEPDAEKPKRGRKKAALEGADADGSYQPVH